MNVHQSNTPPLEAARSSRLLRLRDICALVGVSRSTIYKMMDGRADPFPRPVKVGAASCWPEDEVRGWIARLRRPAESTLGLQRRIQTSA